MMLSATALKTGLLGTVSRFIKYLSFSLLKPINLGGMAAHAPTNSIRARKS